MDLRLPTERFSNGRAIVATIARHGGVRKIQLLSGTRFAE